MRIGEVMDRRKASWARLDQMCSELERWKSRRKSGREMVEFASLYRSACSDLAMAEVYQLPTSTVDFLHRLVGRAHNQLYCSPPIQLNRFVDMLAFRAPQQIFADNCVHICSLLFFGLFIFSAILAYWETRFPNYAKSIIGSEQIQQLEDMYAEPLDASFEHYITMSAFYIQHNTSIGLQCFGTGPTIIWPLSTLGYNAVQLGAVFGYMARPDVEQGDNFFPFVTAHGPFELSAIVLSAAAGLRLGIGLIMTAGLRRIDSMKVHALKALPVIVAAVILFFLAAFTEGFISPSPLPYPLKILWAVISSCAMMIYFVILGFPRRGANAV